MKRIEQIEQAVQEVREIIMNSNLTISDLADLSYQCEKELGKIIIKPDTQLVTKQERSEYYVG